jgi:hypothetical protein
MRGVAEFCQKTSHFYLWGGQMGMGQTGAREGGFARLGEFSGKRSALRYSLRSYSHIATPYFAMTSLTHSFKRVANNKVPECVYLLLKTL